ncbi:MAG: HD-GYP domain-containing protein (c-di-GMP phosphodiesterase class II) [Thermoproteota archaeon]|jgi:HD-GYP domain-containing protein (c-di-GMP phosphodiesterase class II)
MSQALLISKNKTLNNLYSLNLNVYVATNVSIKTDYIKAAKLLTLNPNFDVIITLYSKEEKDSIVKLIELASKLEKPIPVIIVGTKEDIIKSNLIQIPNQYSLKELLKAVANILQVTAQQMAEKAVPKYFPIPVDILYSLDNAICDIYFKDEVNPFEYKYLKIIDKSQEMNDSLDKFSDDGTSVLYVESQYRLTFINETSRYILKELESSDVGGEERVKVLAHGFDFISDQLFENKATPVELQSISSTCVAAINRVVTEYPKLQNLLDLLLSSKEDYIYVHTILATFIAHHIIDNMDWGSKEQKEKIGFCLFFHDIFLVPIYKKYPELEREEDLLFSDLLSEKEKNVVLEHAKMAGEMVRNFSRLPIGADMIIIQHHGMTSGVGFALNYKDDVSPLSKITLIAEEYAYHLYKLKKSGGVYSEVKHEILEEIKDKFKINTYIKLVNTLETLEF